MLSTGWGVAIDPGEYAECSDFRLFLEPGVAGLLGMSEKRLKALRAKGEGPKPYREFANTAWYSKGEIERFRRQPQKR